MAGATRALKHILPARLTTAPPRDEPDAGALAPGEVMTGWVSCDDIETVYDDEVRVDVGAIMASAMRRVEAGLRAAFGMGE
jgi:hypothetical protein